MEPKKLSWKERGQLWLRLGIRLVLAALLILLVWTAGGRLLSLFMPFLLALAAAAIFQKPVRWLQKKLGWKRRVIALLTVIVFFLAVGTAIGFLVRAAVKELISLTENWQTILAAGEQMAGRLEGLIQSLTARLPFRFAPQGEPLLDRMAQWLQEWLNDAAPNLARLTVFATDKAREVATIVLAAVVFLTATYFLCADYPYLRARAVGKMDERTRAWAGQVKRAALAAFGGYLKAQLLLSAGVFVILLIGFALIGQEYALLLALALAVLDFIPLIGAGTVMVPWAIVDLLTGRYLFAAELMAVWGVIVLFRRVAEPKFVGDQTGLSPILSLMSIYIGMRLAGVAGMILGPILTLVVLNLAGLGLFDRVRADLRLAADDTAALLRDAGKKDEDELKK